MCFAHLIQVEEIFNIRKQFDFVSTQRSTENDAAFKIYNTPLNYKVNWYCTFLCRKLLDCWNSVRPVVLGNDSPKHRIKYNNCWTDNGLTQYAPSNSNAFLDTANTIASWRRRRFCRHRKSNHNPHNDNHGQTSQKAIKKAKFIRAKTANKQFCSRQDLQTFLSNIVVDLPMRSFAAYMLGREGVVLLLLCAYDVCTPPTPYSPYTKYSLESRLETKYWSDLNEKLL